MMTDANRTNVNKRRGQIPGLSFSFSFGLSAVLSILRSSILFLKMHVRMTCGSLAGVCALMTSVPRAQCFAAWGRSASRAVFDYVCRRDNKLSINT
jgi:hypothetical protein